MRRDVGVILGFLASALFLGGCSAMTPGRMDAVKPYSDAPRAGSVYLLRGWIGIFSTGIDRLGEKVVASGFHGQVFQDDQWRQLADTIAEQYRNAPDPEPLVLVGHSYGADHAVAIARVLDEQNIPVDLIVTLDPTTPPAVPKNVRRVYNLYQPNSLDALPFMRGIPLEADKEFTGQLENVNVRKDRTDLLDADVNHFNIEKKDKIHAETIKQIMAVCPPRAQWAAASRRGVPVRATVMPVATAAPLPPATRPAPTADRVENLLSTTR